MVFLGGPRQVGKTTLAMSLLLSKKNNLNWDCPDERQAILKAELPLINGVIALDEIYKYKNWRSLVKGFFDKHKETLKIIVTGSARLDHFRKGAIHYCVDTITIDCIPSP